MSGPLADCFGMIASWDWAGIVQSFATIFMAVIAYKALETWKRQSKAANANRLLDELTDAVHEFINEMTAPIEMLKMIKIGIESHSGLPPRRTDISVPRSIAAEVAYIESHGEEDSKRLRAHLDRCNSSLTQIRSLSAKGQVLDLPNYVESMNSCKMLTWHYDRLQAVCTIIGSTHMYWENEHVQESLKKILSLRSIGILFLR